MQERGERRDSYDDDGYGDRALYRDDDRGAGRDPEWGAPERGRSSRDVPVGRRKSRVPVAVAAAIAVVAGGAFAVVKSGLFDEKAAAPSANGQAAQGAPTGDVAATSGSQGAAAGSPAAATASTPQTQTQTQTPTQAQPGLSAPIGGAKVGTFYGIVQHALDPNGGPPGDAAAVPALFASASQLHTYWSSAGKPLAAATCGVKAPTLAVVEAPIASGGAGATVRVDLFEKGKLAAKAAVIGVDQGGKIQSIKCVVAAMPSYPGLSFIVGTYGKGQVPTQPIKPSHTYAPTTQDAPGPEMDADWNVCAQFLPQSWVFYAPVETSAGSAWRFSYDQVTYPLPHDLFVDPTSGGAQRVVCEGLPSVPAPDLAAAGKASPAYGGDPADAMVTYLLQAYARERSLVSAGAQPTAEMAPYFASDDAFKAALSGTGKVSLLCTSKDPFSVMAAGVGTVTGTNEAVEVTVSGAPVDGNRDNIPTIGKATYTVDLTTMKITGIVCH